jgi:hypothetical protein
MARGLCCGRCRGLGPRACSLRRGATTRGCRASAYSAGGPGTGVIVSSPAALWPIYHAVPDGSVTASRSWSYGRVGKQPTRTRLPLLPSLPFHCPRCRRVRGSIRLESSIRCHRGRRRCRLRFASIGFVTRFRGAYLALTDCRRIDTRWRRGYPDASAW